MCTMLQKTGYPHTPTHIEVDNQCAVSILANTVRQILSKSIYIYGSFGLGIEFVKSKFVFIGNLARMIVLIILINTTRRYVIKKCAAFISLSCYLIGHTTTRLRK